MAIKTFGIGLNKTGTSTLGLALKVMGFERHQSGSILAARAYRNGDLSIAKKLTESFDCFEDLPWPMMYKELLAWYPDAKFILTLRKDPETWYQSLCKHATRNGSSEFNEIAYGYALPFDYQQEHLEIYERHRKEVIAYFNTHAPGQLLVMCFEEGDGWNKLGAFLNKPAPRVPFPHLNKTPSSGFDWRRITPQFIKRLARKVLYK